MRVEEQEDEERGNNLARQICVSHTGCIQEEKTAEHGDPTTERPSVAMNFSSLPALAPRKLLSPY